MITQSKLKEILHYDKETGLFTWKVRPARRMKEGDVAGSLTQTGYINISIKGKNYRAHRLAWVYVYGQEPTQIDHINRVRSDNRISNLRIATTAENRFNSITPSNSTSGYKGVSFFKKHQKWMARAMKDGKQTFLGYFDTAELARDAYIEYAKENHGIFFNGDIA